MKTADFNFELPEHLIAQFPLEQRGQSRLMSLDRVTGERRHCLCSDLPEILCEEKFLNAQGEKPLLIFNDTKVRKARIFGKSLETGADTEFLLLESFMGTGPVSFKSNFPIWKAMAKRLKRKKEGSVFVFYGNENKEEARAVVAGFDGDYLFLDFDRQLDDNWFEKNGHVPLPPYIKRDDTPSDAQRYQTIYAKETGSAAAPTAGLHFTQDIFNKFKQFNIENIFITLHVGLGTFLPVRSEDIKDHTMHEEQFFISEEAAQKIENAKKAGRKIIAVGTTSLRALESACQENAVKRGWQNTSIFIYPGYKFKITDVLFTNFHTPQSTLLMLVSAFSSKELILESYAEAVKQEYRFFSYGDAMLIH